MAYLWGGMLLLGIIYAALTGNLQGVTETIVSSSREAVELCVMMAGVTAMWTGILKIAEKAGLVERLSTGLKPFLRFLFPDLMSEEKALGYISTNFLSNMFGLGWASTASGLMAFREMDRIRREKCLYSGTEYENSLDRIHREKCLYSDTEQEDSMDRIHREKSLYLGTNHEKSLDMASKEMCTFLIINVSSLQLIPMTIISYRAKYGSANPAAIAGPSLLTTGCSTLAAVLFCLWMNRREK